MRQSRRATRDQVAQPNGERLSDGIGGTITGGPTEPFNLLEILERGAHGASRGGAVSGAAQFVTGGLGSTLWAERGIALSDGSRICFASFADAGLLAEKDEPQVRRGRVPLPKDSKAPVPRDRRPRARADGATGTTRTYRAHVLASV